MHRQAQSNMPLQLFQSWGHIKNLKDAIKHKKNCTFKGMLLQVTKLRKGHYPGWLTIN